MWATRPNRGNALLGNFTLLLMGDVVAVVTGNGARGRSVGGRRALSIRVRALKFAPCIHQLQWSQLPAPSLRWVPRSLHPAASKSAIVSLKHIFNWANLSHSSGEAPIAVSISDSSLVMEDCWPALILFFLPHEAAVDIVVKCALTGILRVESQGKEHQVIKGNSHPAW